MLIRLNLCLYIVLVSFIVGTATAGVNIPIFEETMVVKDKTAATRQAMSTKAFERVLIRVSGNTSVNQISAIAKAINHPEQYLQAYELLASPETASRFNEWQIRYLFDSRKVQQLLQSNGEQVWQSYRPNVIIWWSQSSDINAQSSEILGHDSASPLLTYWHEQAELRGLGSIFPMTDLATLSAIDQQDIWQGNREKLLKASQRYHADDIVIVTFRPSPDGLWLASLSILGKTDDQAWHLRDEDPKNLTQRCVNQLADFYSQRQTVAEQSLATNGFSVMVTNVRDASAYAKLQEALNNLPQVESIDPLWMREDKILLAVRFQGDAQQFASQIRFDNMLRPVEIEPTDGQQSDFQLKLVG